MGLRAVPVPSRGPALGVVAPFFLAAPVGAVVGGLLAAGAGREVFVAINVPRLVAVTHALVLGWITTTMMGATYQMGPVVLGGRLLSTKLCRAQFVVHALALGGLVWGFYEWDTTIMGVAAPGLVVSLLLYIVNAGWAVARAKGWSLPRRYLGVSLLFLAGAGAFGITYVGTLEHLWFPVTMGRLAAHAHLGLVGWLAITLMGVSYQLVPMFSMSTRVEPRFGGMALAMVAAATLLFAVVMLGDPPGTVRVPLATAMAAGPLLWAVDQLRLLRGRNRRRADVQVFATFASLAFVPVAAALGVGAAFGTPLTPDDEMARWPLAYAAAGIVGWTGTAVLGNSVKINAFLVWIHRYQPLVGSRRVPLTSDLYSSRLAYFTVGLNGMTAVLLAAAALAGSLPLFRLGGVGLAVVGICSLALAAGMYLPRAGESEASRQERRIPV